MVIANREHKKKLVKQELQGSPDEVYKAGEHHIQFGIRVPQKVENGTFYHCGETLNARITYKLTAKMYENRPRNNKSMDGEEDGIRVYRTETYIRVCN
jgi:hypothetical protein